MKESKAKIAKQLWLRAHVHIKKGVLPHAIRDLAKSFELLKEVSDPRMKQVYDKWVTVYNLYEIEKNTPVPNAYNKQQELMRTRQAEAEALANTGKVKEALALYLVIANDEQNNELVLERITELRAELELLKLREFPADQSDIEEVVDYRGMQSAEDSLDIDVDIVSQEMSVEMEDLSQEQIHSVEDQNVFEMTGEGMAYSDEGIPSEGSAITLEPQPVVNIDERSEAVTAKMPQLSEKEVKIACLEELLLRIDARKKYVA